MDLRIRLSNFEDVKNQSSRCQIATSHTCMTGEGGYKSIVNRRWTQNALKQMSMSVLKSGTGYKCQRFGKVREAFKKMNSTWTINESACKFSLCTGIALL